MSQHLYVTVAEVRSALGVQAADTLDDSHIQRALEAASAACEKFCGDRRFWLDAENVERSFTARGPLIDLRPDLATLDTVTVDGIVWVRGTDFELEPLNAPADARPFEQIRSLDAPWPTTVGAVKISGKWGWPEVPAEVPQAALLVAERLVKRKDSPFGIADIVNFEGVAMRLLARFDADGSVLLHPLRYRSGFA